MKPELAPSLPPPSRAGLVRWIAIALAVAAAGTFFVMRIEAPRPLVFPAPGEIRFFDTDPYYHTRHATHAAMHYPHLLRWDTALYPDGVRGEYVGLFDLTIATTALIVGGGHPTQEQTWLVAAWVPPVIGTLAVLALFWLGWVIGGPVCGAVAAIFLVVAPGLFANRALLGYPDHHVAEVLLGLLVIVGVVRLLQREHGDRRPVFWRPAVLESLPMTLFFLTWLGAPIYLVLVGVTFFVVATFDIARGVGAEAVGRAAFRYAFGMVAILIPIWIVLPSMILHPKYFRYALVATTLVGLGIPFYAWAARGLVTQKLKPALAAILGVGGAALVAVLLYAFLPFGHLFTELLVGVKTSLVREQAEVDVGRYFFLGGLPAALAIGALPLAFIQAARGRDKRQALPAVLMGTVGVALWLRTHDYGYTGAGYLSLMAAYVVVTLGSYVPGLPARAFVGALLAAGIVVPAVQEKVVPPYRPTEKLKPIMIIDDAWAHALKWLKAHTPELIVPNGTEVRPDGSFHHPKGDYGVLAFWDFGHFIAAVADRLPLASGGISGSLAKWFLIENEEDAIKPEAVSLRPGSDVRYVMVDARTANDFFMAGLQMAGEELKDYQEAIRPTSYQGNTLALWVFGKRFPRTMISRLYLHDGVGLAHYRMIYETVEKSAGYSLASAAPAGTQVTRKSIILTPETEKTFRQILSSGHPGGIGAGVVYDVSIQPTVKIFEVVPGAVLEGKAAPGAVVEAKVILASKTSGRTFKYTHVGQADGEGHYRIVVPYGTDGDPDSDVSTVGPYDLASAGTSLGSVGVPLESVRTGSPVQVSP